MSDPCLRALTVAVGLAAVVVVTATWHPRPVVCVLMEDCGNCFDDDGDGLTDRKDPECTLPANGNRLGVGANGKALTKCEKAVQKAGAHFVVGKQKRMHKCLDLATSCVQLRQGVAACQTKASAGCAKALSGIAASGAKLEAAIVKTCDREGQSLADLRAPNGLGFDAEEEPCDREGNSAFTSSAAIAACIRQQHACRTEHLVGIAVPRATELLTFAGRDPASEFPCLAQVAAADGGGVGVGMAKLGRGKAILKCGKAVEKVALTLTGAGAKAVQACVNAAFTCVQVQGGSPPCTSKTQTKCQKLIAKLDDPVKGTVAKATAKLKKACTTTDLNPVDIFDQTGLGFEVQSLRCAQLEYLDPGLDSLIQCLGAQLECEGAQMVEREVPRARELGELAGVDLPGLGD